MIQKLSHATVYVLDQDEAKTFYTEKLGFEVRTDETMGDFGGFRWLTVGPKTQPDLEIILMPIAPGPMLDERRAEMLRELVGAGTFGFGAMDTDDADKTYEELQAAGVETMGPPQERFYGKELLFKDNSGNWFSLVERR